MHTARADFAIYYSATPVQNTLADGTKQLVFSTYTTAMEVFNDTHGGLWANNVAPGMAEGVLTYTVTANADGSSTVSGQFNGGGQNSPSTIINFGPSTETAPAWPLDANGFPSDQFFYDPYVPFTLDSYFPDGDAQMTGTFRMRFFPPN